MTSIEDLAQNIRAAHDIDMDAARNAVTVHVDQISDDPDLWDAAARVLTAAGVEVIAEAIRVSYEQGYHATTAQQLLDAIADEAAAIRAAEEVISERTERRNELIRAALRTELRRADIAAVVGVKEARLYQIRDRRR